MVTEVLGYSVYDFTSKRATECAYKYGKMLPKEFYFSPWRKKIPPFKPGTRLR